MSNNRLQLIDYLEGQGTFGRNYIINPSGTRNVIRGIQPLNPNTNTFVTRNTSTALTAISDIQVDFVNGGSLDFVTNKLDRSLTDQACEMTADYRLTLANGASVDAQVLVNGQIANSTKLTSSDTGSVSLIFPCGNILLDDFHTVRARFVHTTGIFNSTLHLANVYVGATKNIGTISQAEASGSAQWVPTTACEWSTTSTTYADFAANSNCPSPLIIGTAAAPSTAIPQVLFSNAKPGTYVVNATFTYDTLDGDVNCSYRIVDGDGNVVAQPVSAYQSSSGHTTGPISLEGQIAYGTAADRVFKIQAVTSNAGTACVLKNNTNSGTSISVTRFPSSADMVVRQELPGTRRTSFPLVWNAPTAPNIGNGLTTSSYVCAGGGMLMVNAYMRMGSTTNYGSGGYDFNLPVGFTYNTGFDLQNSIIGFATSIDASSSVTRMGAVILGGTNKPTIIDMTSSISTIYGAIYSETSPIVWNTNDIIRFNYSLPVLECANAGTQVFIPGSVYSSSSNVERMERANINIATTCQINSQSGSWISSTVKNGTGDCTLNLKPQHFSSLDTCVATISDFSTGQDEYTVKFDTISSTQVRVIVLSRAAAGGSANIPSNSSFRIMCMGPR